MTAGADRAPVTTAAAAVPPPPLRQTHRVRSERRRSVLIGAAVVGTLLLVWLYLTYEDRVDPLFLPGPDELLAAFNRLKGNLPGDVYDSVVLRIVPGFVLGGGLGLLVGMAMAVSWVVRAVLDPVVEVLRPLPPLAIIPLLILWFGIGNETQLVLIAFGAFIVMVVTTFEAVRNVPPIYLQAARTLGAGRAARFRRIIVPAIMPDLFGGIRVAVAASFGYCIAAELIGAQSGLGYRLVLARRFLLTENIVVVLIVIALLAFVADQLVRLAQRRLTDWKPRA